LCWDARTTSGVGYGGAARGTSVVVVIAWGATEVTGTMRGAAEVDEAHDEEAAKGWAVGPPRVMV
jgi:hypothetical protein